MTNFMVLYRSTMAANEQMAAVTPEEMQAEIDAWMAWGAAAGEHLVDFGSPTMPTGDTDAALADHPRKAVGTIEVLELLPMPGS